MITYNLGSIANSSSENLRIVKNILSLENWDQIVCVLFLVHFSIHCNRILNPLKSLITEQLGRLQIHLLYKYLFLVRLLTDTYNATLMEKAQAHQFFIFPQVLCDSCDAYCLGQFQGDIAWRSPQGSDKYGQPHTTQKKGCTCLVIWLPREDTRTHRLFKIK